MEKATAKKSDRSPVLLLSRDVVATLMRPRDYLAAVEVAFRASIDGRATSPVPLHVPANGGGFHAKAALLRGERTFVAVKINANFPGNPERRGLPTIQGTIVLFDGETGEVLSIMDSIEITLWRTAAASALAARHLANRDSRSIAICGCGQQGRVQLQALAEIFEFGRASVWDIDPARAAAFAAEMAGRFRFPVDAKRTAPEAIRDADIVVTCTTARSPFVEAADVKPGAFIAAVGADSPDKSEIAPALMRQALIVVDTLEQCLVMGDLHHAVAAGAMQPGDVMAGLSEIIAAAHPGRTSAAEIIIFDSTGTAIQDVASASLAYERAVELKIGTLFPLATTLEDINR